MRRRLSLSRGIGLFYAEQARKARYDFDDTRVKPLF